MLIKIVKCSVDTYWYSDKIGKTFNVNSNKNGVCFVTQESCKGILASDCKILKEDISIDDVLVSLENIREFIVKSKNI